MFTTTNQSRTGRASFSGSNHEPPQNPVSMVQSLVPHLPGLDKDTVYVISGPFPNYDPVSGPSQLLMATPISPGVTVVAVPHGPPPGTVPINQASPSRKFLPQTPNQAQTMGRGPPPAPAAGPMFQPQPPMKTHLPTAAAAAGNSPNQPHMLHWDMYHPVGQAIPLRQPNPPVYYNVPSHNSSGLTSPGSEGSSMSCSDISEESEEMMQGPKPCFYPHHSMPPMMGYPPHLRHYQGQPQFCNPIHQGQMYPHQAHHGGGQHYIQGYIS